MTIHNVALAAASVKSPSMLSALVLTDDVAALIARSYGKGAAPISAEKPAVSKLAKAKKEKGESKKSTEIKWLYLAPKAAKRPEPTAEQFLVALRGAGYTLVPQTNPITGEIIVSRVFDEKLYRFESMFAVAIYQGWTNEPWGTQIDRAELHARAVAGTRTPILRLDHRAVADRPSPFAARWSVVGYTPTPKGGIALPHRSAERHNARWTAEGWTAGAPDAFAKIQSDLDARERLAVSEVATLNALLDMSGKTSEKAAYGRRLDALAKEDPGLAALVKHHPDLLGTMLTIAEQRLATVRADLEGFNFSDPAAVETRYASLSMRGLPTLAEGLSLMNQFAKN